MLQDCTTTNISIKIFVSRFKDHYESKADSTLLYIIQNRRSINHRLCTCVVRKEITYHWWKDTKIKR